MDLIGLGLLVGGLVGSTYTTNTIWKLYEYTGNKFRQSSISYRCYLLSRCNSVPDRMDWRLKNLARFHEWVWFVLILIFSWITLLVYLFAGPTTPEFRKTHNICRHSATTESSSTSTKLSSAATNSKSPPPRNNSQSKRRIYPQS